jgi:hypothetical protein
LFFFFDRRGTVFELRTSCLIGGHATT